MYHTGKCFTLSFKINICHAPSLLFVFFAAQLQMFTLWSAVRAALWGHVSLKWRQTQSSTSEPSSTEDTPTHTYLSRWDSFISDIDRLQDVHTQPWSASCAGVEQRCAVGLGARQDSAPHSGVREGSRSCDRAARRPVPFRMQRVRPCWDVLQRLSHWLVTSWHSVLPDGGWRTGGETLLTTGRCCRNLLKLHEYYITAVTVKSKLSFFFLKKQKNKKVYEKDLLAGYVL